MLGQPKKTKSMPEAAFILAFYAMMWSSLSLLKLRSVNSPDKKKGHEMNFLVTNAISRMHPRKQGVKLSYKTAFVAAAAIGIWAYISL